jgi:hypothetical protein
MTQPDKSAINELNELVEMLPWLKDFQRHWQAGTAITGDGVVCKAELPAAERQEQPAVATLKESIERAVCRLCGSGEGKLIIDGHNREGKRIMVQAHQECLDREQLELKGLKRVRRFKHPGNTNGEFFQTQDQELYHVGANGEIVKQAGCAADFLKNVGNPWVEITERPAAPQPLSTVKCDKCNYLGPPGESLPSGDRCCPQCGGWVYGVSPQPLSVEEARCRICGEPFEVGSYVIEQSHRACLDRERAAAEPQKIVSVVLPNAEALCAAGQRVMREMASEPPSEGGMKMGKTGFKPDGTHHFPQLSKGGPPGEGETERPKYNNHEEWAEHYRKRAEQAERERDEHADSYRKAVQGMLQQCGLSGAELCDVPPLVQSLKQQLAAAQLGPMGVLHGKSISGWREEATHLQSEIDRLRAAVAAMRETATAMIDARTQCRNGTLSDETVWKKVEAFLAATADGAGLKTEAKSNG